MGYILLYIRDGCDVAGNGQINHQLYLPFTIVQSVMWSRVIRITYNIQNLWIYLLHSGLKCTQGTDRQTKHTWSKWLLNNVNTEWQPNKFTQSDTEFNNHFSMLYSCYHEMLQAATLQNASDAPVLMLLIARHHLQWHLANKLPPCISLEYRIPIATQSRGHSVTWHNAAEIWVCFRS